MVTKDERTFMVGGLKVILNRYTFATAQGTTYEEKYVSNQPWYGKITAHLRSIEKLAPNICTTQGEG